MSFIVVKTKMNDKLNYFIESEKNLPIYGVKQYKKRSEKGKY